MKNRIVIAFLCIGFLTTCKAVKNDKIKKGLKDWR